MLRFRLRRSVGALAVMALILSGAPARAHANSTALVPIARVDTGSGGDIAFWGSHAFVAQGPDDGDPRNDGFTILDIADPQTPRVIGSFRCVGSAYDIGVWDDLVFLSVDEPVHGTSCDSEPASPWDDDVWAGVRIISVADPQHPKQVTAVQTALRPTLIGSHTHTILPDLDRVNHAGEPDPRLLVFASGAAPVEIISVPLRDPSSARVVEEFAPPPTGGCHDIAFFRARNLAVCNAIQPDTQLWDVSDAEHPVVLSHILNPLIEHHHSSAFSNDGRTLIISEENLSTFASGQCLAGTGAPTAALWFYDITDPALPRPTGYFQLPEERGAGWCSPHQLNVIPMKSHRDVLVSAWYGGGTTVVDFTDPSEPIELAWFAATPSDAAGQSFPWASYWYNGAIYANNLLSVYEPIIGGSPRGLDILRLDPPFDGVLERDWFNFGGQ